MKTLEVRRATAPLADYVRKVRREPVILTDGGRPVAALVAIDKADLETAALATHPVFLALIERSRTRQRTEGGISSAEMRRRLGVKSKRATSE